MPLLKTVRFPRWEPIVVIICAFYLLFWGVEYASDVLARYPVLDARENLDLAQLIRERSLAKEPFYRAMLYPYLLAYLPFEVAALPMAAIVFGLCAHCMNAVLVGRISRQLWGHSAAGLSASVLYGVYPVAIYFSVQILDITLSITFFLLSLNSLLSMERRHIRNAFMAGLWGGLAVLTRPNFLPVILLLPFLGCCLIMASSISSPRSIRKGLWVAVLILLPLIVLLFLQGRLNYMRSGEFRILPWQGSYNLYVANGGSANGKYMSQQVVFDRIPTGANPTRMESEYRYRLAHGEGAELDVSTMETYWRQQLNAELMEDPLRWMRLIGKKALYLCNDWEQYNNLTYAYHKERFTYLSMNPLGWGVLSLLAGMALVLNVGNLKSSRLLVLLLVFVAYALGVLMFFVSARFRLPLAPLLCMFAGGCIFLKQGWLLAGMGRRLLAMGLGIVLILLSYPNWSDARSEHTYIQDEQLLSEASLRSGDDHLALLYAERALARDSSVQHARKIQVASLYNLWLIEDDPMIAGDYWLRLTGSLQLLEISDPASVFIQGVVLWRSDEENSAKDCWELAIHRWGVNANASAIALDVVSWPDDNVASMPETLRSMAEILNR